MGDKPRSGSAKRFEHAVPVERFDVGAPRAVLDVIWPTTILGKKYVPGDIVRTDARTATELIARCVAVEHWFPELDAAPTEQPGFLAAWTPLSEAFRLAVVEHPLVLACAELPELARTGAKLRSRFAPARMMANGTWERLLQSAQAIAWDARDDQELRVAAAINHIRQVYGELVVAFFDRLRSGTWIARGQRPDDPRREAVRVMAEWWSDAGVHVDVPANVMMSAAKERPVPAGTFRNIEIVVADALGSEAPESTAAADGAKPSADASIDRPSAPPKRGRPSAAQEIIAAFHAVAPKMPAAASKRALYHAIRKHLGDSQTAAGYSDDTIARHVRKFIRPHHTGR